MKRLLAATTAMVFAVATPAAAQQDMAGQGAAPAAANAGALQPGTAVYGSDGAMVGTVSEQNGDAVILKVGEQMIPLPRTAIGQGANGPMIGVTRSTLVSDYNKRLAEYEAKLDEAVKVGVLVKTSDDQDFGTIESVEGDAVSVQSPEGPLNLTKRSLALNADGGVIIQATMAQVREAMSGAASQSR